MDKVFIYWDNSNIFLEARRLAEELESGPEARYRVRINFANNAALGLCKPASRECICCRLSASRDAAVVESFEKPGIDSAVVRPR